MANDVMFEGKERRMPKIEKCLAEYGIGSLEEARELCKSKGFDPYEIVKGVQPLSLIHIYAVRRGVGRAHIIDGRTPHSILVELFTDEGIGTMFY